MQQQQQQIEKQGYPALPLRPHEYYTEELLRPLSTWRHARTGAPCTVLGVSESSTNGGVGKRVVVYVSHAHQQLRHLALSDFLDGRFDLVPAE